MWATSDDMATPNLTKKMRSRLCHISIATPLTFLKSYLDILVETCGHVRYVLPLRETG